MAIATLIEKYAGTVAAKMIIYYSPAIILLLGVIVVNFIAVSVKYRLFRKPKWGFMFVHIAFIVILLGALVSHIFGEEGVIHLREGQSTNQLFVQTNKGETYKNLPFSIQLKEFVLTRYPGSHTPSSYESVLIIHTDGNFTEKTISVNKVLDIKGYRLFQSSYDKDEKGSILAVNRDVPGRQITYTGYFLLIVGFILFLTSKNSRLRQLSHRLKELNTLSKASLILLILLFFPVLVNAQNTSAGITESSAEALYNHLNIFPLCKVIYLISGSILLLLTIASLFVSHKWVNRITPLLNLFILGGFLYHLFGIGLRWYIAGYAPWSNLYETMVFVSLISVLIGLIFYRQSKIAYALAVLFGGVILFVSGLSKMDPEIGLLVPVLKSPWLIFHVSIIMISYGFFGVSFLLGVTNLILLKVSQKKRDEIISIRIRELSIINEMSLWIGLCFLTVGTFLGAIWANETWGRYWGWDPKETWALITIIAYAIVTHFAFTNKRDNLKWLNAGSVIAFFCVLMTYFGVSYFLSGMHAY